MRKISKLAEWLRPAVPEPFVPWLQRRQWLSNAASGGNASEVAVATMEGMLIVETLLEGNTSELADSIRAALGIES